MGIQHQTEHRKDHSDITMTILCKEHVRDQSSNIKITVYTDIPTEEEKKEKNDVIITSNARELNKRLELWSKTFDEILLNYRRAEMQFNSKYNIGGGSVHGKNSSSDSSTSFVSGYCKILDPDNYHPSEVELSLPEEGTLVVKGMKIGQEFEETLELPPNVDDEEIIVEVNSKGKLVIRAPFLT